MSINLSSADFTRAAARAAEIKPVVRRLDLRCYAVAASRGGWYRVVFAVAFDGRFGSCNCAGGRAGRVCYHLAAAAALHRQQMADGIAGGAQVARWHESACPPPPSPSEIGARLLRRIPI